MPTQKRRNVTFYWVIAGFLLGAMALLLWPGTVTIEADIFVPFEMAAIPDDLVLTETPLKGVEIKVSGPARSVEALQKQKLSYVLDLKGLAAGYQQLPLHKERLALPGGISIIHIGPPRVALRAEKKVKKTVPILITLAGKPQQGFSVMGIVAIPPRIDLCGPESLLNTIASVKTKPVELNQHAESFRQEIILDLPENVRPVSPPDAFFAELSLEETLTVRTFTEIPVTGSQTLYHCRITPCVIRLDVKGPVKIMTQLDPAKDIAVHIDLKGLTPGVYVRQAIISLPLKTTLAGVSPKLFTVKISGSSQN